VTTTVTAGGTAVTSTTPAAAAACPSCGGTGGTAQIYQVELLSRQVVRVIIPKGVYYKDGFVDISIATPYGVSPALQVPVIGAAAPAPPPAAAYKVSDTLNKVKVTYGLVAAPEKAFTPVLSMPPEGSFRIDWDTPEGNTLKVVDALFTFKIENTNVAVRMPLMARNGYFEVADGPAEKTMSAFATLLLQNVGGLRRYTPDKLIPSPLEATITFTSVDPAPDSHAVKSVPVSGKVQVELQQMNILRQAPPPPFMPVLPPPMPKKDEAPAPAQPPMPPAKPAKDEPKAADAPVAARTP
jgi:hypothetical protein